MQDFGVDFKKYESDHAACPYAHKLQARNKLFGIYSVEASKEPVAIVEQINQESAVEPTNE